jgi:hypothetical protein
MFLRKEEGLFCKNLGMTPRNKMTTTMFITIPATLTKAYFLGLPSCLSLANGSVASVSKNMIQHIHDTYCGCLSKPAALAMLPLNNYRIAVKIKVVNQRERDKVL